ncbi:polyphosphate--glucose phosphotransferase [Allosalinactinospora lopnorensis]|uniref:polyphosphate--glucose phosphotransferase n=1 Tax=Allosalinactinospora lopnorensis TaxID=1352348 RepID=UPI000623FF79|nr:ROK family protein [Allosalinactinospora lopnorensis]
MADGTSPVGLGIDIGGSGIKGAPVDLDTGEFTSDRLKILTPVPATPAAVAAVVAEIAAAFPGHAGPGCPVGVAFPGVVKHGVARSAAHVAPSWVGVDTERLLAEVTGQRVHVLNDADAAAVAEHRYGAAQEAEGVVLMTTLGTGIGTALLVGGRLVPNTELGHVEIDGHDAETRAASSIRKQEGLSYRDWAEGRLQRYYSVMEDLLSPDLIVVGGGVSRKADRFLPHLRLRTPIVAARLRNTAGIAGAAITAAERLGRDGG